MPKHLWFTINFLLIYDVWYIRRPKISSKRQTILQLSHVPFRINAKKGKKRQPAQSTLPFVIYGRNFHIIFGWMESKWKWNTQITNAKINKQKFNELNVKWFLVFFIPADGLIIVWIIKFISSVFAQIDHKKKIEKQREKIHTNNDWPIIESKAMSPHKLLLQ